MRALGNTEMLEIVERGGSPSHPERALRILAAAYPDEPEESLRLLPLGERDRRLLALRGETFGNRIQGLTDCPLCASSLTVDLDIDQLLSGSRPDEREFQASVADYELRFRSPNSDDMLAALHSLPSGVPPSLALARRILRASRNEIELAADDLPSEILDQASDLIEGSDPGSEIRLAMQCPECSHSFNVVFDIVSFLWSEVSSVVRQLLVEVHLLASAYGWSEGEILRMSPWRRAVYLGMVN